MKLNQNNLLIVLAVISVIKFIVYPVIEWQNETVQKLSALDIRLNKSHSFINEMPRLQQDKETLLNNLAQIKQNVDSYQDISTYQIGKQKEIEALFVSENITIKSFNWRDVVKTEKGTQLRLVVQYSGLTKDFMLLHMKMSKFNNSVEITNLGLNIRGQDDKSLGVMTGNIVFLFSPLEVNNDNV